MSAHPIAYQFRLQINGCARWLCPWCGNVNIGSLSRATSYRLKCRNEHCRRVLILGHVGYVPSAVRGTIPPPPDVVIPSELRMYVKGQCVNRIVENVPRGTLDDERADDGAQGTQVQPVTNGKQKG